MKDFLDEASRFWNPDADDPLSEYNNLIGTPEQICDELACYVDIGVDEVVVEFVDFPNSDGAELFAEEVIPNFK